ncbi:MAG: hypothetical protein HC876_18245 [Chloroflexaceae bacterium]|nr:hypothetical protein [Chloroflexaceae bacterium]NJO07292.1 hypothetical protein [Chloroflexaceae bacterium]
MNLTKLNHFWLSLLIALVLGLSGCGGDEVEPVEDTEMLEQNEGLDGEEEDLDEEDEGLDEEDELLEEGVEE